MKKACVALAALLGATAPEGAQSGFDFLGELQMGDVRNVDVSVSDQVKDGCWLGARGLKDEIELLFAQHGLQTTNDAPLDALYSFTATGYALRGNACAVAYHTQVARQMRIRSLRTPEKDRELAGLVLIYSSRGLMSGPKSSTFSDRIRARAMESAREFLNGWRKAQAKQ